MCANVTQADDEVWRRYTFCWRSKAIKDDRPQQIFQTKVKSADMISAKDIHQISQGREFPAIIFLSGDMQKTCFCSLRQQGFTAFANNFFFTSPKYISTSNVTAVYTLERQQTLFGL